MVQGQPINQLVDRLPAKGLTVFALRSLDIVVPGEWDNLIGWAQTLQTVTGEDDPDLLQSVSDRAIALYNDSSQGYQNALFLYHTIDLAGSALGTAALAHKVGEKVRLLSFLDRLTPKADTAQVIDLSLKVVVELAAFCQVNGLPGDSLGDFVASLGDYSGEALMRMAALVCFDGLIPLGPDFIGLVTDKVASLAPADLEAHQGFRRIQHFIPGGRAIDKLGFVGESFNAVSAWMANFVADRELTPASVVANLHHWIEVSDDRLDYLAAFLDISTNYYEHTGVQTLARRLIDRAYAEI